MADENLKLSGDRDLGTVVKKDTSGMYETNKGERIPPFPGVTIGSKIKLVKSQFEIAGAKQEKSIAPADKDNATIKEMQARIDALEGALGEKGSSVKRDADLIESRSAKNAQTPPKAGE